MAVKFKTFIDDKNILSIYANDKLVVQEQITPKEAKRFDESCFIYGKEKSRLLDKYWYINKNLSEAGEDEDSDKDTGDYDNSEFNYSSEDDGEEGKGKSVPSEFEFNSRIIFISNLNYIPEALADRCIAIEMNFTKEQILEYIKQKLSSIIKSIPNATMADAIDTWNFISQYINVAKKISFRVFQYVLSFKVSGNPEWKKFAYIFLKSGQDPFMSKTDSKKKR